MVSITMFCIFAPHREIDGEVYVGEVKEKEKAKKQYEKAVSSGQTAGLVKWVDPRGKIYKPSVASMFEGIYCIYTFQSSH